MRNFLSALKQRKKEGPVPVIPDVKCFSPKDGDLLRGRDPVRIAKDLEAAGACCLSVVTEEKEFHGSVKTLREICSSVGIPVLRKDFLETVEDLEETRDAGASAVLLMYSCLGRERLSELYRAALGLGLTPFVETHTEEELKWAAELESPLVGINNRNIRILEKDDGDVSHAERLLKSLPPKAFVVVESGLTCASDVRRALKSGADAVLVGTAILNKPDYVAAYRAMTRPCGLKICGLMDEEGIDFCIHYHVDMVGFVTEYPVEVPWNLSREKTASLIDYLYRIRGNDIRTCIVAGGGPEKVISLTEKLRPYAVQLHGTETFEETERIARMLSDDGIHVIRSVPSDRSLRKRMFGTGEADKIIRMLEKTPVETILLDSRDAENAAEGGGSILKTPDLARIRKTKKKLMIGGGITAGNVREAIDAFAPDFIDIMTGSENEPGKKSEYLIGEIVRALES